MTNTTISNQAFPTERFIDAVSAALVKKIVIAPLVFNTNLPVGTLTQALRKKTGMAEVASKLSQAASYSTVTPYITTSVNMTAGKTPISSTVTVEVIDFQVVNIAEVASEQSNALTRTVDTEISALFTGFSNQITSVAGGALDDLTDSVYLVNASTDRDNPLRAIIGRKFHNSIVKEMDKSGASSFTIESNLSLLGGGSGALISPNGYAGSRPGLEIYVTSGFAESGSNLVQAVFDPTDAIAAMVSPSVNANVIFVGRGNPSFVYEVSSYLWSSATLWRAEAGAKLLSDI